jgi:hypothetical protein
MNPPINTVANLIAFLQALPANTKMEALTRVMIDGSEEFEYRPLSLETNLSAYNSAGTKYLQFGEHPRSCREIEDET